jgi:hypothetical protein
VALLSAGGVSAAFECAGQTRDSMGAHNHWPLQAAGTYMYIWWHSGRFEQCSRHGSTKEAALQLLSLLA